MFFHKASCVVFSATLKKTLGHYSLIHFLFFYKTKLILASENTELTIKGIRHHFFSY